MIVGEGTRVEFSSGFLRESPPMVEGQGYGSKLVSREVGAAMTLEEFEKASEKDLRNLVNECFTKAETAGGLDKPNHHREAEFYMSEIERRKQGRANTLNFWMELIVIALILGEAVIAYWEGNKQAEVLTALQNSFAATAATLTSLQGTTEAMNAAIQRQSGQVSDVSVDITCSPIDKRLLITNTGKSDLLVLGYQFDGRRGPHFKPPLHLGHGEFRDFPTETTKLNLPKPADGEPSYLPFRVSLQKADGTEFTSEATLSFTQVNDEVRVGCGPTLLTRLPFTGPQK
jgi:hypothetical protein